MKQIKGLIACASLFFFCQAANAQHDSTEAKSQFKLSINYNTRLNYYGRTDSLKSSGFFPMAELWFTPKFYLNAAPVFVNNSSKQLDYAGTVATIGYQSISSNWIHNIYVTKPFYKESSELVQSSLKVQSGLSLTYQNKFLNVTAGGDAKFSDKVDYGASAGLDHIVRIVNKDKSIVILDPSVYAYAGTQNFQRTYYKRKANGLLLFSENNEKAAKAVSRFNVLAFEASMPVIYARGKVMLIATPSYILPQNLTTPSSSSDMSEQGESMFYASLTAKYTF